MTLLSLFMTSTGIFCFVPISQRLIESGIVPTSESGWFFGLFGVLEPAFCDRKGNRLGFLLAMDDTEDAWSDDKVPLYSEEDHDTVAAAEQPATPRASEWSLVTASSPKGLPTRSPIVPFHGPGSASPVSVCATADSPLAGASRLCTPQLSTLCDSCDALLRHEIPPDHIPSIIRALALFEVQDRLCDIVCDEYDMAALTDAFSMLRM